MKKIIPFLFFTFFIMINGCSIKPKISNVTDDKKAIIKTDEDFSSMSLQHGMKKAFIQFMDNEGVLLRPGHMPIVGADAVDFLSQANDSAYKLTWKPSAAEIAASGDLGFTYGTYLLQMQDTSLTGTYVSIWKKQPDGKWKFILDSGNEGTKEDTSAK